MRIRHVFYAVLFTGLLWGPNSLSAQHRAKHDTVQIIQGSSVHSITNEDDSITLGRQEFHIRYHSKKFNPLSKKTYALRLAVMEHPDDKIHPGTDVETVSYFRLGTGMANNDNNLLIIADGGNNYIIYQDEQERRADLVSQKGDDLLLDIDVKAFYVPVSELEFNPVALKDTKMKELWFIMWYDRNLNNKIEKRELNKVHVRFR